ncbi:MAG: hypothetical protein VX589_08405 [Myxococcota bacterium]|nr:hypothetical protein [Myxococcota bacterium]
MVLQLGLVGHNIQESFSPTLHHRLAKWADIHVSYDLYEAHEATLDAVLPTLMARGVRGFNVTAPFKETIMRRLHIVGAKAQTAGAANTVSIDDAGVWAGVNTDVTALTRILTDYGCRRVLLLGAGGAARAVCVALREVCYDQLIILNRSVARTRSMVDHIALEQVEMLTIDGLSQALKTTELVINTLPPTAHQSLERLLLAPVPSGLPWIDLSYGARLDPWRVYLSNLGFAVEDGLRMFILQGLAAFERWTGCVVPFSVGADAVNYHA